MDSCSGAQTCFADRVYVGFNVGVFDIYIDLCIHNAFLDIHLSLIIIYEPTRLMLISIAGFGE